MYIKRDKVIIKRIVLDLHDVIAEHCRALCFTYFRSRLWVSNLG